MDSNEGYLIGHSQFDNCKFQWTDETTKLLIYEVRSHIALLDKKNYMQKRIWKIIANKFNEKGYSITEEQCNVKWKNLKQKYRSVRDRNNKTGTARECWEYFDLIDDFINIKPEVAPVSIASSTHGFRINQSSPSTDQNEDLIDENNSAAANTSYGKTRNIRQRRTSDGSTWAKVLHQQRQKHHEENIKMQKEFLVLFKKYVETQRNN